MRFLSFTSGSCGNCYYLGPKEGGQALLIDAGASMRSVKKTLLQYDIPLTDVSAILITHDHLDHIRFLGTFCKYLRMKVCTTFKLHGALASHSYTRDHIASCRHILQQGEWNELGEYQIRYFVVPHDATQTVGYAIKVKERLIVLMTDLEHVPQEAMELAKQADTVIIESNYDKDMLLNGPYPPELKKRILAEGHLSNDACGDAIREFYHPGLKNLFLCHLSGNNNTPQLAYDCARKTLGQMGLEPGSINLRTLARGVASPLINL